MQRAFALVSLLSIAACAGPRYAERAPAVPPPPPPAAPAAHQQPQQSPAPAVDDAATRAWLDREIEHNRYVPPPPPPVEVVERVVERPVYVREPVGYYEPYDRGPYYRPYYHYGPYGYRSSRSTTFPLHTALGAGVGAIVGHQSGHRGRGAWIGGGLGLLMDLGSRW